MIISYLVKTKEENDFICKYLHEKKYRWNDGNSLLILNYWNSSMKRIVYLCDDFTKRIRYGTMNSEYYKGCIDVCNLMSLGEI